MKPIPYTKHSIDQSDIDAVISVLQSDFLTQGPKPAEFERELAACCGSKYAVVFSNGTAALHGAYFAAGLGAGDEFITAPLTFAATVNAGVYLGATPVLCDISMKDYTIDQERVWRHVTDRAKAIVPVAYAGYPIDLKALREKAAAEGITVILDAAHALGATVNGEPISKHADMTMLSFHPAKHVATGEGGAVLTDNKAYYDKLMMFRTHGITKEALPEEQGAWYYEMRELGFNYRLTDIQCALGISQLKKLDASLKRRKEIADRYKAGLSDLNWLTLPPEPSDGGHAWHLYPVLVTEKTGRRRFFDYLRANGISPQVHYIPVHYMPYYRESFKTGDFPNAEDFYEREVSLPMFPALTDDEQGYVIDVIKRYKP
ncbi:MAG: UDP-4-amino-4,6-dideoxy-N-acetyl-beta-L-altrosamine transaminase [Defluviitaleaceae bacterium]|nr:UDP-4-amino-4,6-dideoxy-N-acetyl-beta-L-altrosamine transaminase [Defluviitaleaceae bacterium]